MKFDTIYQNIIKEVMVNGIEELNQRTGQKTKSLPGISFNIDLENDGFPILTLRKLPFKSAIAEILWYIQGNKDATWLQKYTKMWNLFLEKDNTLKTHYGYRWRHHFGTDQLQNCIDLLKKDPSSRQAVVITWSVDDHGAVSGIKRSVPCLYSFTLNIIGDRLNMMNTLRSNDMILGCPFDVLGFSLLLHILAQEIGVKPGVYTHVVANAHIYENHYDAADEIIKRKNNHSKIELKLPENTLRRAENEDENIVQEILNDLQIQYNPLEAISNLNIAL